MAVEASDVFAWLGTASPTSEATATMEKVVAAVIANAAQTHTVPEEEAPDWDLGITMQCARMWKRKSSPEGVISSSDFGVIRTSRFDSDIERLLDPYVAFNFA